MTLKIKRIQGPLSLQTAGGFAIMFPGKKIFAGISDTDRGEAREMKQIGKRTACLLLSAILLLGSLPIPALAADDMDIEEEIAEESGTILEEGDFTQEDTDVEAADFEDKDPEDEETENIISYGVIVDGVAVTSENYSDVLGDGTVFYTGNGELTLKDACITSIESENDLTIVLAENQSSSVSDVLSAGNITIEGKGKLTVMQIMADGDLTISANVEAGVPREKEDDPVLNILTVKHAVIFTDSAHLRVDAEGHNAVLFTDTDPETMENNGIFGAGYYRTAMESTFGSVTEKIAPVTGGCFEFVSLDHLQVVSQDDEKHMLACKMENTKGCPMEISGIAPEAHVESTKAGCEKAAFCNVCNAYFGEVDNTHSGTEEWERTAEKHTRKYSCCGKVTEAEADHCDLTHSLTEDGSSIERKCGVCEYVSTVFAMEPPEDLIWDGSEKTVSVDGTYDVVYSRMLQDTEEALAVAAMEPEKPIEPGTYRAEVTVTFGEQEYTPWVAFTIAPVTLTEDMVTLSSESEPFVSLTQEVTHPAVTVKRDDQKFVKGTHYTVEYWRDGKKVTSLSAAGDYTVKIIGKAPYMNGTVEKPFTITKAALTATMFEFKAPAVTENAVLAYDGTAKTATVTPLAAYVGVGTVTVTYYKNNVPLESDKLPTDSGTYTVKINVTAGDNYAAAENLTQEDWKFTIEKSTAYTDDLGEKLRNQTIIQGSGEFIEPTFTSSITEDKVKGTIVYKLNNSEFHISSLKDQLKLLEDDATGTISYTFTPDADSNYTGIKEGTINIIAKAVTFHMDGKPNGFQASDLVRTNVAGKIVFGDTNIIDTSKLHAKSDGEVIPDVAFTVKYESLQQKTIGGLDAPVVGANRFRVVATGKLGDTAFTTEVCQGEITVLPKPICITTRHTAAHRTYQEDTQQALLTGTPVTDVTEEGAYEWMYRVNGVDVLENGVSVIPKKEEIGVYEIQYYAKSKHANYADSEKITVKVAILPQLTAEYGQNLSQVQGVPGDGKWKWALNNTPLDVSTLADHPLGNAGENDDFQMVYNNQPDVFPVVIQVNPKPITDPAIKADTTIRYNDREDLSVEVYDSLGTADTADDVAISAREFEATLEPIPTRTGRTTLTVKNAPGGNYAISEKSLEVLIYRPYHVNFTALQSDDDLKETDYNTVSKVKAELRGEIQDMFYPEDLMKYFKIMMTYDNNGNDPAENWIATRNLDYYPEGGFTVVVPYSKIGAGLDEDDDYRVSLMDAATSTALGTTAGSPAVEITDFQKTEKGIQLHSDGYAIICIAPEADLTTEYAISKSIVLDNKTSTKGSLSIKVDGKTATKATYGTLVKVTAKANNGYSIVKVTAATDGGAGVALTKTAEGSYAFHMPADNVTVTLSLKKTTSSSKNPSSGDTSHIGLWLAVLAVSGLGMALMVFKRKKK